MKASKFLAVLLLLSVAFVRAEAPPQYDTGPDQVQVFIESETEALTLQAATVDLFTLEVTYHLQESSVEISAEAVGDDMVAIRTQYPDCQYLYVVKRPKGPDILDSRQNYILGNAQRTNAPNAKGGNSS